VTASRRITYHSEPHERDPLYEDEAIAISVLLFGSRTCPRCGMELGACSDYFGVDRSRADGLCTACRSCRNAADSERYRERADLRDQKLAGQRARYRRMKGQP